MPSTNTAKPTGLTNETCQKTMNPFGLGPSNSGRSLPEGYNLPVDHMQGYTMTSAVPMLESVSLRKEGGGKGKLYAGISSSVSRLRSQRSDVTRSPCVGSRRWEYYPAACLLKALRSHSRRSLYTSPHPSPAKPEVFGVRIAGRTDVLTIIQKGPIGLMPSPFNLAGLDGGPDER